jgi:DNA invertase Pin-like site-specific DNA recombinase
MRRGRAISPVARLPNRRCAIYTRKSSEEGLEQEFNSLDAQRDACEAYARSQRHEGWTVLSTHYDDGGLSGGTLDRPALQRLLADIRDGKVDLVLVYKVDRLTRSLADFAKIVEVFDAHNASFVSVTQHFNTATSMGRLTLNMLLSFAQFEREVAGERIRDKIAASKRKGMWMGGTVPLGYAVFNRKLVAHPAEAETVRHIFRCYLECGSVRELGERLEREGIRSRTGAVLGRGPLYHLLQNRAYRGEVVHKGNLYPGEHPAIVDADVWELVQQRLAERRAERWPGTSATNPSLLPGLLFDAAGGPMTASHAVKGSRRYRYYVSRQMITGTRQGAPDGIRVPAAAIEQLVIGRIRQFLVDPQAVFTALRSANALPPALAQQQQLLHEAKRLDQQWPTLSKAEQRTILGAALHRVEVGPDQIAIHLRPAGIATALRRADYGQPPHAAEADNVPTVVLRVPAALRRAGKEMALLIGAPGTARAADPSLVRLIAKGWALRQALIRGEAHSLTALAAREGVSASYASRLLRLAWLAPAIVEAIMSGQQPPGLSATRLTEERHLPMAWYDQRSALGLG